MQYKVQKEDFLLSQIDAFKEKAKQLKGVLMSNDGKGEAIQ